MHGFIVKLCCIQVIKQGKCCDIPSVVRHDCAEKIIYFRTVFCCDLMTFFTIFASSTRNARRILGDSRYLLDVKIGRNAHRDFTQEPHREPPYARQIVFWRLEMVAYWRGRRAGIYTRTKVRDTVSDYLPDSANKTYSWKTDTTVTAFWPAGGLFEVVIYEFATRGLDHSPAVGGGVVGSALAKSNTLGHRVNCWCRLASVILVRATTSPQRQRAPQKAHLPACPPLPPGLPLPRHRSHFTLSS